MKLFIQSSDAGGQVDGTVVQQLLKHLPITDTVANADAVIVPVGYFPNYRFEEKLNYIKKPIILIDYTEYAWNWDTAQENVLGRGMVSNYGHLNTDDYRRLDDWARDNPCRLHFKRELTQKSRSHNLLPVEFLCYWPKQPIQTREEFNSRPIEVFHNWGLSHPLRPKMHGEIIGKAHDHGYGFVDAWNQRIEGRVWTTIHTPHYNRVHMSQIMEWNGKSKISLSLPGAGKKCFRHAESGVNSVMALPEDDLAWSIPWEDKVNCIRLKAWAEFETLVQAVKLNDLYDIYLRGQETIDRYRPQRYAQEYIIPEIKKAL